MSTAGHEIGALKPEHLKPLLLANSICIRLEGDAEETFNAYPSEELAGLNRDQVKENLLASGQWLALRTRPYTMVPHPDQELADLFVTAIDSNPLAPDPQVIIAERADAFGNIHVPVGRTSWEAKTVAENVQAFIDHINSVRPTSVMNGISVLTNACFTNTRLSDAPLARAERM